MEKTSTELFQKLQDELDHYRPVLTEAADVVETQDVSLFPIFVVHQHTVDIGINIVERGLAKGNWSVNASTLEEFVAKQILSTEKIDDFKTLYRSHPGDLCLFVLSELGANFIFLPKKHLEDG